MRATDAELSAALDRHGDRIERYLGGKSPTNEFQPVRLSYGLYYQLDHTSHMQRIKLPAGLMTVPQMRVLADIADDYARGIIHVTTRQDVQLHWIELENVMPMYRRLHDVGITTRGACADSVRNVTGAIRAGTLPGELFDITAYALAVHEYFLFHPLNLTQPRKFKIAFAGEPDYDSVQARINEIAFFPKQVDGRMGFSVWAAGGLGAQPHLAQKVRSFVPAEDLLLITEALVRLQHRSSERKNRKRARMKYLFQKLGAERFIAELDAIYAQVERDHGDALRAELQEMIGEYRPLQPRHPGAPLPQATGEFAHWLRTNTFVQKQAGYFIATVQLPLGDLSGEQLHALADIAETHGAGEARTANDQNIVIPWIPGDRLQAVYEQLCAIRLGNADAFLVSDVVSCPGADYCNLAMSRSMGVATDIRNHFLAMNGTVEDFGVLRVRISGCPNACGQHQVGDIGLTGQSTKGKDGKYTPHYSMLLGGVCGEDESRLGARVSGRFGAEDVPRAVAAVARLYQQQRQAGELFGDFVSRVGADTVAQAAIDAAPSHH